MLMRFDPFRELDRLTSNLRWATRSALPLDAYREGDHWVAVLDLPGVDPASIDVTVDKNVLTVTAERRWQPQEGQGVLTVRIPAAEQAKPRKVQITAGGQQSIEATATESAA
jgi:HSP20 family protein